MKLMEYDEINVKQIFMINEILTPIAGTHIKRPAHSNNQNRLFYNLKASSLQTWDTGSITVNDGDVVYIPSRMSYTDDIISDGISLISYIDISFPQTDGIHKWSFHDNPEMKQHFISLYSLWKNKKCGYYIQCMCEIYNILGMIIRSEKADYTPSASLKYILPAIDYMKSNFQDTDLTIPKLAELCGISYSHFRRLFFDVQGMSANTYLKNLRLENACKILTTGDYTVSETANMSGFSDVYYFSSFFKKYTGFSPSEYPVSKQK